MHRRPMVPFAAALSLAAVLSASTLAANPNDSRALRNAVTLDGLTDHLEALQAIANANGGTRVDDTPGYEASVQYAAAQLTAAGYSVTIQPFSFDAYESSNTVLERTAPSRVMYSEGYEADYLVAEFSGSGDVTAPIQPVDVTIPYSPTPSSSSGCEASDFAGFVPGRIALVQRGTCAFAQKTANAIAAGAAGMIIFNEGQPDIEGDDRVGVVNATLGGPQLVSIPVFGTTYAIGADLVALASAGDVTMRMATDAAIVTRDSANVLADTAGGRPDRTVVVGAHLDSVAEGPGINDNGSGIAAVLEIARQVAGLEDFKPRNRIRFALWGGEEFGLLGAEHYVATLPAKELKNIAVNLNFDMIGSPNWVPFVYDGDGSATGGKGPSGSGNVESVFNAFLASQGVVGVPTAFDGRSDYGPFIAVGIPAGGLFTGAEGIKTAEEAALYGGTAGVAYDPCYHLACDTFANVSDTALDLMADAAAHATYEFAMTTSSVNGASKASVKSLESGLDSLLYRGNRQQR